MVLAEVKTGPTVSESATSYLLESLCECTMGFINTSHGSAVTSHCVNTVCSSVKLSGKDSCLFHVLWLILIIKRTICSISLLRMSLLMI